jgi:hypothetical protein
MQIKRFPLFLLFLPLCLHGQEKGTITTRSAWESNRAQSLWFGSSNAAGMALTPLYDYNLLEAQYHSVSGNYKLRQEGQNDHQEGLTADGALRLGKYFLWGHFTFADRQVRGSTYNTNRYEASPDMPYYVADTARSDWKKQSYDMACKVAFPLSSRLLFGGEIRYIARKAAKQLDPRSVISGYSVAVKPGWVFRLSNRQHVGVHLLYQNAFDRNTFTNSLTNNSERVYLLRGLGHYSTGVVGGTGGISPFYYPSERYGGGLQYDLAGRFGRLLAELSHTRHRTDAFEDPAKPRRRGTTQQTATDATLQWLKSDATTTHKLLAHAALSATNGIEYLQEYNGSYDVNQWITIAQYVRSTYRHQHLSLTYNLYRGAPTDYTWTTSLRTTYSNRQDEYLAPQSVFHVRNIFAEGQTTRRFRLGARHTLHAGIQAGYNRNLRNEYRYNGPEPSSSIVRDFFAGDLHHLATHYLQTGCRLDYSLLLKSKTSLNFHLHGEWIRPVGADENSDRRGITTGVSYLF